MCANPNNIFNIAPKISAQINYYDLSKDLSQIMNKDFRGKYA